jgi:hypothetical protein
MIAMCVGNPHGTDQWEWRCGFYPGSRPGEIQSGTAGRSTRPAPNSAAPWNIFLASRRRDIDAALAAFVDRWLQTVRDDGRFKQLYAAWFE